MFVRGFLLALAGAACEKFMANTILVGAQWGDEGKGKIIDVLTETAGVVVRYAGGNNAGHTVIVKGKKTVLHLIRPASCAKTNCASSATGWCWIPSAWSAKWRGSKKTGSRSRPGILC